MSGTRPAYFLSLEVSLARRLASGARDLEVAPDRDGIDRLSAVKSDPGRIVRAGTVKGFCKRCIIEYAVAIFH